ncbi:MAG: Ig-like domain-containing protein, partial [Spirochaetes bacterium]|nr:Ig-like domain-containing protein [Spirochaetota bacterium]
YYISGSTTNNAPADVYISGSDTALMSVQVSLPQNKNIYVKLTRDIKTVQGTSLENDFTWIFKTLKPLSGTVSEFPVNGTTNVVLTSVIEATFATNLSPSTINEQTFYIIKGADRITGSRTYDDGLKKITFTPAANLRQNTFYTAFCTTNIKTVAGTSLASNKKWVFRTMKAIPLSAIREISPQSGSSNAGVGVSPFIRITNSYPVDPGTVNALSVQMENLTIPGTVFGDVSFDAGQNKITFDPPVDLDQGNWYRVTITTNVRTTFGTTLESNYRWNFKTQAPYPYDIAIYSPTNSVTNVGLNTVISVTFYTDIDNTTVTPATFQVYDETGNYVGGSRAVAGPVVTFTPTGGLLSQNTSFTVYIPNDQIKYTSGIYVVSGKKWWFRTLPPLTTPSQIFPMSGQQSVGIDITIFAKFGTALDTATCTKDNFKVYKGDLQIGGSVNYDTGEQTINFLPTLPLEPETAYTVLLTKDVKTTSGVSMVSNYQWNFETGAVIGKNGGRSVADGIELIFPPHSLSGDEAIIITKLTNSQIPASSDPNLVSIGLGYRLEPEEYKLKKSVTMKIDYSKQDLTGMEEKQLAIFYYDGAVWTRVGGTLDAGLDKITVTFKKMGIYAVFEDRNTYTGDLDKVLVDCQPRVFKPSEWIETSISFELPKPVKYSLKVYNIAGKLVKVLADGVDGQPGQNVVFWDGKDLKGELVPNRIYVLALVIEDGSNTIKKTKTVVVLEK